MERSTTGYTRRGPSHLRPPCGSAYVRLMFECVTGSPLARIVATPSGPGEGPLSMCDRRGWPTVTGLADKIMPDAKVTRTRARRGSRLRAIPGGAVSAASPGRQGSAAPLRALDHLRQQPKAGTYGDAAQLWSGSTHPSELRCYFK
jgi:hypothetical protein